MSSGRTKVTIVGGGVAALEALIALRHLAEERVDLELVTPRADWSYRPLTVAEPFDLGEAKRYDLVRIASDHGARLHLAGVQSVDPDARRLHTWDGRTLEYEILLLAIGAVPTASVPGSVTLDGPAFTSRFRALLRELEAGRVRRLAFAVPAGTSWPLPLYELALMTAAYAAERDVAGLRLSLISPEQEPLELFGAAPASAVRELLNARGVEFHGGRYPAEFRDRDLTLVPSASIEADGVVSLPRLRGPAVPGLPHDTNGFIPTDLHGRVEHEPDVYAAGDVTSCPIKQGGIAAQMAGAVAEAIAARLGADLVPRPFKPVLRGLLLTGREPRFMRAEAGGAQDRPPESSPQPLWWPPSKVATHWLAPYLAAHHGDAEHRPDGPAVEVDAALDLAGGASGESGGARGDWLQVPGG
jgi:sulfide:quinone oxidoreductase